jgi:hypothetical protein
MEQSALAGEGGGVYAHPPFSLLPSRTKLHSLCFISALWVLYALIIGHYFKKAEITELFYNGKKPDCPELWARAGATWTGDSKCRAVKTGLCWKRPMQTGSSETRIGWKSGKTTCFPLYGTEWRERGYGPTTLYLHRLMTRSACPPGLAGSRL